MLAEHQPSSASVLVVEDDAAIRLLVVELLADAGFLAHGCANGAEALALLDPPPDVIVLDLNMPVMGGRDFLHALRSSGRSWPPILILSARGGASVAGEFGTSHLDKPFDVDTLLARVADLVGVDSCPRG